MIIRDTYVSFRCYPESISSQYYTVYIFDKKSRMYDYYEKFNLIIPSNNKREGRQHDELNFLAITNSWRSYKGNQELRDIGQVLFYSSKLGAGIVAHEMSHAALYWFNKIVTDPQNIFDNANYDERFAWALGNLVNQFWDKYWSIESKVPWLAIRNSNGKKETEAKTETQTLEILTRQTGSLALTN